jgi:hypothetical protein
MQTWNALDELTRHPLPAPRTPFEDTAVYPSTSTSLDTADRDRVIRPPSRMRTAFAAWREVRRINRAYRRERRAFDRAVDQVSASPGAEQELHAIWARR